VTDQNLFDPAPPPAEPPTVALQPGSLRPGSLRSGSLRPGSRWPGRRRATLGAAVLGVLAATGLTVALLLPADARADAVAAAPAVSAPPGAADGPDRQRRGEAHQLGADTLLIGSVVSTADGNLVVAQDGGPQRTVHTSGSTRIHGAGQQGLAGLRAGDRVLIRVSGTGDAATAVTIRTPKTHVTGTVSAIDGDTATVLRPDGLTTSVNVAAVNPKPAVGNLVVLTGRADGATVVADRARVLPRTP
jgi:hypothetical protein